MDIDPSMDKEIIMVLALGCIIIRFEFFQDQFELAEMAQVK